MASDVTKAIPDGDRLAGLGCQTEPVDFRCQPLQVSTAAGRMPVRAAGALALWRSGAGETLAERTKRAEPGYGTSQ